MCRKKGEREKRCDCDTSEARRLRRYNRAARERALGLASNPNKPNFLPIINREEPSTSESVKIEIDSLKTLTKAYKKEGNAHLGYQAEYDRRLHSIGTGIEFIAENIYGAPKDEELSEKFKSAAEMRAETFPVYYAKALAEDKDSATAYSYAEDTTISNYNDEIRPLIEKRNEAIKKALSDVGVIFATSESLQFSQENSDEEAINSLKIAATFFPQSWIDESNEKHQKHPFIVKNTRKRAEYEETDTYAKLMVSRAKEFFVGDAGTSIAIHEFGHRMQDSIGGLERRERIFVMRRIGRLNSDGSVSEEFEQRSPIYKNQESNIHIEKGWKDNFPHHYMGKHYDMGKDSLQKNQHGWEIFSTGMEALFGGNFGGFAGITFDDTVEYHADPDFKRFMLGLLASSANANIPPKPNNKSSPNLLSKILGKIPRK